jgi:hypothetical protein
MTRTEQRLREAFAEGARTVRPETVRSLSLPRRRRRLSWPVPAISAAAVALSVVLSVLVGGRAPTDPVTAGGGPAFLVATVGFGELPKGTSRVEVRDAQGRVYDQRPASHGLTFQYVAAAPDDRTFFVMEVPIRQTACNVIRLYRMKVAATGKITAFAPLGARVQGGTMRREAMPGGLAASPDGRRLAYAVLPCGVPSDRLYYKIGVVDLRTGAQREWTDPQESVISSLSWTSDARQIVFLRREPTHARDDGFALPSKNGVVRMLDIASKSTDLRAGTVLLRQSRELRNIWAAVINGDGTRVTVVAEYSRSDGALSVCQVSIADGRVLRMLHREGSESEVVSALPGIGAGVALSSDASGRHLLYYDPSIAHTAPGFGGYGRIDDGRFRAIPVPHEGDDTYDLAW